MSSDRKLISFVVPVLNEEENIPRLYATIEEVMAPLADRYKWEYVFTDNRSSDRSFPILCELAERDPRIRAYRFSRNFGYQNSILTGYRNARGEAAIQLDCDLQDPPTLIPEFLAKWESGYQVVYGVRIGRKEGSGITLARMMFYRVINWLSEDNLPLDAGDFRLIDRKVLEELAQLRDSTPYLRGVIASLGFEQVGILYQREARLAGESKFRFRQLAALAVDGIIGHSIKPLRLATWVGLGIFALTGLLIAGYAGARLFGGVEWPAGFTTLVVLILISQGINAIFFGIFGEYLGRIYRQVKHTSHSVVDVQTLSAGGDRSAASPIPRVESQCALRRSA
ncbi:MAG: glycosyltransferase family 2 protein [Planctomycetaceae bacterium]|nr:glycosyltransferase family 2 protein [Planctomycetaceae bacterium]